MQLTDKVVFITGGASGIGAACAKAVLEKGAKVVIADINDAIGQALVDRFNNEFGAGRAIFAKCDVTNAARFKEVFSTAVTTFKHLDVMVNNAGILNETNWEKMLDINLKGTIIGTELALAHMRKDKGGHGGVIINVASVSSYRPAHFEPIYVSSKHAVLGFTRSLASAPDLSKQGVRYACLCPEAVDTPLFNDCTPATCREGYFESLMAIVSRKKVSAHTVAEGLLSLIADDDCNGALLHISLEDGLNRKKIIVDNI